MTEEAARFPIDAVHEADAAGVRAVVAAAFGRPDEADLVDRLRDGGHAVLSLIARRGGTAVGHVLFSRLAVRQPEGSVLRAVVLAPVSVDPASQRRGIGTALVREGLARLDAVGEDLVLVLGDPQFYGRFGFRPGRPERLATPYPVPENQWLALGDRPLPLRLALDYPPPFADLG